MASKFSLNTAALYLACASIVSYEFSIAVANILFAIALAALLFSKEKIRFPPIWVPLTLFCAGTVVSMIFSDDPWSGRPQIRKFLLYYGIPLLVYSVVRTLPRVKGLLLAAAAVMASSALWSLMQFAAKIHAARASHSDWYDFYTGERITGFMSHWMTVGGQEMMVLLMSSALLFWAAGRSRPWLVVAITIILASLIVGFTRSIWLGTFCGGVYLLWQWKRWWVFALPVPLLALVAVNPFDVRERVRSAFEPHGDTDSNQHRYVCRRTGLEMIKAHPWLGLGPEQVRIQFKKWVPPDIAAHPLPTGWYGHLHNIYYHFAAERGIPTMLALMWLFGKILYDFLMAARRESPNLEARGILYGAIAVMIGMLAVGFYEVNIGDSEVLTLFLAIVACGYVARDEVCRIPSKSSPNPLPS